jgi:hypothetical protein
MEQKQGTINISTVYVDDTDGDARFSISVSNGYYTAYSDFHGDIQTFKKFAIGLIAFPRNIKDEILVEAGKKDEKYLGYLFLKAFCYDASGHTALRVRIEKYGDEISSAQSEFTIVTDARSINKLGQLLLSWDLMNKREIEWFSSIW